MKRVFLSAAMLALMPASIFASSKSQTIHISEPLMCGSTQLAPGDYKVTWDGSGPIVHVKLTSGRTSVSTDARLIAKDNQGQGGVVFGNQGSVNVLEEIDLRHSSLVLENK